MDIRNETYIRTGHVEQTGDFVHEVLIDNRQVFLHWLIRRVGSRDRAEDLLQEFYLRAKKNAPNLQAKTKVIPWLYRVLHSTLIDFLRAEEVRKTHEADFAWFQEIHASGSNGSFLGQSLGEVCHCLHQAMAKLQHGYRELLNRIDLLGHDRRTVADQLSLTLNNLAVRGHRARQALKQSLLGMCSTCPEHGFRNCECDVPGSGARPA